MKNVLITGNNGFIGKNLQVALKERANLNVCVINRLTEKNLFKKNIKDADFIFHLAGSNRSEDENVFLKDNSGFTSDLCQVLEQSPKKPTIVFSSSIMVKDDTAYGRTKYKSESILKKLSEKNGNYVVILRLPNVFGKWALPNYNSVVATFCNQAAKKEELNINDENRVLNLLYIDDLVQYLIKILEQPNSARAHQVKIEEKFDHTSIKLGDLARIINSFAKMRALLSIDDLSSGIERQLYSTFLTYLSPDHFVYKVHSHKDARGKFSELFKSQKGGQVSVFTAKANIKRGGHFHHTKVEKFFVVQGQAKFTFKKMDDGIVWDRTVSAEESVIVETIPGWCIVENIGNEELIVIVWANEIYNPDCPDTYECKKMKFKSLGSQYWARDRKLYGFSRIIPALDKYFDHILIHTGQNHDYELNQVFFDDLNIRRPDYFLDAATKNNVAQTIGSTIAKVMMFSRRKT